MVRKTKASLHIPNIEGQYGVLLLGVSSSVHREGLPHPRDLQPRCPAWLPVAPGLRGPWELLLAVLVETSLWAMPRYTGTWRPSQQASDLWPPNPFTAPLQVAQLFLLPRSTRCLSLQTDRSSRRNGSGDTEGLGVGTGAGEEHRAAHSQTLIFW